MRQEGNYIGYQPWACGFQRLTSSGSIGDAGKPIAVYGFSILSGSTAAIPYLINGAAYNSGAQGFRLGPVVASQANVVSIPAPVMLPNGAAVSFDANTTEVTVFYVQMSVTS